MASFCMLARLALVLILALLCASLGADARASGPNLQPITGALAPVRPGVLKAVEAHRIAHGWHISEPAPDGVILIAIDECAKLGKYGIMRVARQRYPLIVRVVDCRAPQHAPLSALGIAADIEDVGGMLAHQQAEIWIAE